MPKFTVLKDGISYIKGTFSPRDLDKKKFHNILPVAHYGLTIYSESVVVVDPDRWVGIDGEWTVGDVYTDNLTGSVVTIG